MVEMTLDILGAPRIYINKTDVRERISQKAIILIVYLILNSGDKVSRELLASYLWDNNDIKTARYNLRHTIWKINQLDAEIKIIDTNKNYCSINKEIKLNVDVLKLECLYENLLTSSFQQISNVLEYYRSDFMDGQYYHNATMINDWILNRRQYYQRLYFEVTSYLGDKLLSQKSYDLSHKYYKKLLSINPLHEDTYLKLIENRIEANDRVTAINYYQLCKKILREELNIDPNEDIQSKYDQIVGHGDSHHGRSYSNNFSTMTKQRIEIEGTSFFEYEFISRLVDKLLLSIDTTLLSSKEQNLIYYLKPVYPQITDYLSLDKEAVLDVKNDIGIYYGLITLIECLRRIGSFIIIINDFEYIDLPSKKIINSINVKMKLTEKGLLIM